MENQVLVSIVMPVYNAQNHLNKTMRSIADINFKNFELILVNDGSSDQTPELLKDYAARDARLKVITIPNGGPANARNIGIDHATGKYLFFMDCDDTIESDTFDVLLPMAEETNSELIIFGFTIVKENRNDKFRYRYKDLAITSGKELGKVLSSLYIENILNQVWNKLYRADIIKENKIRFMDYRYGEDRIFVFDTLEFCSRIQVVDKCLYNYHMNETESLITRFYDKKFESCLVIDNRLRKLAQACQAQSPEDMDRYDYMFMKSVVSCMTNLFSSHCPYNSAQRRRQIRMIVSNENVRRSSSARIKNSMYFKAVQKTVLSRNVTLNYIMANAITRFSSKAPGLFVRIKHNK